MEQRDCATLLRPSLFIIIAKSSPVNEGVVWRILKPTLMVPCLGIESSTWNRLTDSWKFFFFFFFFFARGTKPLPALWIVSRTWAVDSRTISDAWDLRGDLAAAGTRTPSIMPSARFMRGAVSGGHGEFNQSSHEIGIGIRDITFNSQPCFGYHCLMLAIAVNGWDVLLSSSNVFRCRRWASNSFCMEMLFLREMTLFTHVNTAVYRRMACVRNEHYGMALSATYRTRSPLRVSVRLYVYPDSLQAKARPQEVPKEVTCMI